MCELTLHRHRRCFIFLFVLFENIGELEKEKIYFFLPLPLPPWAAVNKSPAVFILYHARSTDFEEIEGPGAG